MSVRVRIFQHEFKEFSNLDYESTKHLINLYDQNFEKKFQQYSIPLVVAGTYFLWVSWLFFNGSAGKTITN
jgi:ammonia channel protein AmtB